MNYLLVPDKFKGSLTASQVIEALQRGIFKADPGAVFFSALVSDGGDGFIESVANYTPAVYVSCEATDPLGRKIQASYLYDEESGSAYIEMAQTAGLELLRSEDRNPLHTTTYGTGLQIMNALEKGSKQIYIGLGGSATTDAAIGIAMALGYQFLDENDQVLQPVGNNLVNISKIIPPDKELYTEAHIYAINDVNNPLFGTNGAAFVYGPQKGASPSEVEFLDYGLRHLDQIIREQLGKENAEIPGAGAAGGTAYGLMTFLGAEFIGGTKFVLELAGVSQMIAKDHIDYIITGEGKIDGQTLSGKLIHGILELGRAHNIPVIAICGALEADEESLKQAGLSAVLEVRDPSKSLAFNMEHAATLVESSSYEFFKSL